MALANNRTHIDYLASAVFVPQAFEEGRRTSVTPEAYRAGLVESAKQGTDAFKEYILDTCADIMGDRHAILRVVPAEEIEEVRLRLISRN